MKIAQHRGARRSAIPLAQEFHWAGGAQIGANLVLFAVHTDDGVIGYGESICEDPRAVVAHGELMARQVVGRSPGDMEAILRSIWTRGALEDVPAVHAARLRRHRSRLLGRARPRARRADADVLRRRACRTRSTTSASCRATTRTRSRRMPVSSPARATSVIYLKVGRGAERDEACVAAVREAIGPGAAAADRPERGVGRRDRRRPDPPARAVRPRLGRAADARTGRQRPRARAPLGRA